MADAVIERLYDVMKKIEENKKAGNATENVPLFNEILQGTTGDSRSKRLASQFIARLFKDFPEEQAAAYEAMVDLMEDEDVMIRKQVISDLPKLCKDMAVYAPKVADLLVQMMQTDDSMEQSLVNQALMQTLTAHPAEALTGLFDQLTHEDAADLTRERTLRFLAAKLPHLSLTPQQEELLVQLTDRLLDDVTEEEFGSVVQLLATLRCMRSATGRQRLVDTVCQQADLAVTFDPANPAAVARARECASQAAAFLGRGVSAKALLVYYLDKVLPVIDQVPDGGAGASSGESPRLELLRCLTELSCHAGSSFVATDKQLNLLLTRLKDLMPLPPTPPSTPSPHDDASPSKPEEGEIEATSSADVSLNFSQVECLLFAFHQLARTSPDFLTACPERMADFAKRIKFFNQASQIYLRSLRSSARGRGAHGSPPTPPAPAKKDDESAPPDDEAAAATATAATAPVDAGPLREAALTVMENIARLIRDLSRNPPVYRAEISCLSWQQRQQQQQQLYSSSASMEQQRKRRADSTTNNGDQFGGGGGGSSKRRVDRDRYGGGGGGGVMRNRRGGNWKSQHW